MRDELPSQAFVEDTWNTADFSCGHSPIKEQITPEQADKKIISAIDDMSNQDECCWTAKKAEKNDAGHGLFQYPAMMVPSVQRRLIGTIIDAAPSTRSLFDPFIGAATTAVAGMAHGLTCIGQDINPLAVLLSRVRTFPFIKDADELVIDVVARARADTSDAMAADFKGITKWFKPSVISDLSKLRRAIREEPSLELRRFLWVTMSEVVRLTSNDRTSTFKLHMRPLDEVERRNPDPIAMFESIGKSNAASIKKFGSDLTQLGRASEGKYSNGVEINLADSCKVASGTGTFDLLVTSPPYGDNLTTVPYGQHSYLELQWVDLKDIDPATPDDALRTTQEIDRRSVGGKRSTNYQDTRNKLCDCSKSLRSTIDNLRGHPSDREERIINFCNDLQRVFDVAAPRLAPNAYLVFTVGDRTVGGKTVPNTAIIGELLSSLGIDEVKRIDRSIFNKRMPTRNDTSPTMAKETITIYRKAKK